MKSKNEIKRQERQKTMADKVLQQMATAAGYDSVELFLINELANRKFNVRKTSMDLGLALNTIYVHLGRIKMGELKSSVFALGDDVLANEFGSQLDSQLSSVLEASERWENDGIDDKFEAGALSANLQALDKLLHRIWDAGHKIVVRGNK